MIQNLAFWVFDLTLNNLIVFVFVFHSMRAFFSLRSTYIRAVTNTKSIRYLYQILDSISLMLLSSVQPASNVIFLNIVHIFITFQNCSYIYNISELSSHLCWFVHTKHGLISGVPSAKMDFMSVLLTIWTLSTTIAGQSYYLLTL